MENYKKAMEKVWREELQFQIERINKDFPNNIQNVFTPYYLCHQIVGELKNNTTLIDKDFAVFNLEFIEILLEDYGIMGNRIWFITDCQQKVNLLKDPKFNGVQHKMVKFNKKGIKNMKPFGGKKFDVTIGNPPYQDNSSNKGSGHTLWDGFIKRSFEITKENGYICFVNPCGWRRVFGTFSKLGKMMMGKYIKYLEIHDIADGQKIFKNCTRYDWYIMQNCANQNRKTIIVDEDGRKNELCLSELSCIPNGEFEKIFNLMAKIPEERIQIINDRSSYGADKAWVSKNKDNNHQYPCVYSLPKKGMQLYWSSIRDNGHFGIIKLIWSNGFCPQIIIDKNGEYGLTQWAFAIVDDVENLKKIKTAMESKKFVDLCKYMKFTLDKYDPSFIATLKKDFWKEFVAENGEEK